MDDWFVGFFEGDGSFQQGRDLAIVLTQKQTHILHVIQQHYQRGAVLAQKADGSVSRFIVRKKEDIIFFVRLLHNKLRLSNRQAQLASPGFLIMHSHNQTISSPLSTKKGRPPPSNP